MATVVNDRDVLIMSATPRFTVATDRGMFLTPSAAIFKLSSNGLSASPSQFVFKATLLNLPGTVSFSWTGGLSFVVSGNQATLDYANAAAVSGTLTATIIVDGVTYTQIATVTKLADGLAGLDGVRGNIDISVATSASAWSDAEAAAGVAAAGFGAPRTRDVVNLYRADRTWAQRRIFDGSSWLTLADVFDGSIFVKGSVLAEAIDSRNLTIKDENGKVLLGVNVPLAASLAAPGTLNSDLTAAINAAATAAQQAKDAAASLNTALGIIGSDNWLSMGEKPAVVRAFADIDAERTGIAKQAADLGINANTYQGTIDNLASFLSNNVGPNKGDWSNTLVDSPYDGVYMTARFNDVAIARQALLDAITAQLRTNAAVAAQAASAADGKAAAAAQAASKADDKAAAAQQSAKSANDAIAIVGNDNVLDRGEKARIITEFKTIDTERIGIAQSASALGLPTDDYQHKCDNLAAYLSSVGPNTGDWSNVNVDSAIDGPFLRDRFTDVYTARQVLLNAISAQLRANATAAAQTATAGGITGQMTVPQVASFIPPNGITNTQFGGDLYSTNWNGYTDARGAGWYLQRSGNFFGFNVILRGAVMSANMPAVGTWLPAGGGNVMYFGPEGMQVGNFNDGTYVYIAANGNIQAPGFRIINKQVYFDNPTITGGILDAFYANQNGYISGTWPNGGATYGTLSMNIVGGRAPFNYYWFINILDSSGTVKVKLNFQGGAPNAPNATLQGSGTNDDTTASVMCICIDANGRAVTAAFPVYVRHGVPP